MEMFRNMEVVLMLCFGLICATALVARPSVQQARAPVAVEAVKMPVVIVTGKRLSADEKAQLAQQAS
ncbi:MAG: hypothetical protein ACXWC4_04280 [Telluria sp.]